MIGECSLRIWLQWTPNITAQNQAILSSSGHIQASPVGGTALWYGIIFQNLGFLDKPGCPQMGEGVMIWVYNFLNSSVGEVTFPFSRVKKASKCQKVILNAGFSHEKNGFGEEVFFLLFHHFYSLIYSISTLI